MTDVEILLICQDEAGLVGPAVAAARAQVGVDAVVVGIANGPRPGLLEELRSAGPDRIVEHPVERTYAVAYNEALAQTTAPAVLTLNADCFLDPGFCAAALDALEGDRVGSVQGKLLRATGPGPGGRTDTVDSVGIRMNRFHRNTIAGHGEPAEAFTRPGPVFGPDGAAAVYRREMLEEISVGGEFLDASMESYGTDVDLAWRARLHGWRSVFEPGAVAYHVRTYSPSTRASVDPQLLRLQFRNRYLMMLKNETGGTLLRHLPAIAAFEVAAVGHALVRERFLLAGYREALRLAPGAIRRRRADRPRRTARAAQLAPALAGLAPESAR